MIDHKLKMLNELKQRYFNRENIIGYLKEKSGEQNNSINDILISYDLQSGSYIKGYYNNTNKRDLFAEQLAKLFDRLGPFNSIVEAGVGEAVSLANVLRRLQTPPQKVYGFDLAWSRIKYAHQFLKAMDVEEKHYDTLKLFTGDMFSTPFADNSLDLVFTVHAAEPNGGKEKEILTELYRISNKYLVLLEPAFELANEKAKERMLSHGYVTSLYETAKELKFDIIEHRLFEVSLNPLNPTGLLIIRKNGDMHEKKHEFNPLCCPITHSPIKEYSSAYYSSEAMLAYPILDSVPCLLPQNALVATHFLDFINKQ